MRRSICGCSRLKGLTGGNTTSSRIHPPRHRSIHYREQCARTLPVRARNRITSGPNSPVALLVTRKRSASHSLLMRRITAFCIVPFTMSHTARGTAGTGVGVSAAGTCRSVDSNAARTDDAQGHRRCRARRINIAPVPTVFAGKLIGVQTFSSPHSGRMARRRQRRIVTQGAGPSRLIRKPR